MATHHISQSSSSNMSIQLQRQHITTPRKQHVHLQGNTSHLNKVVVATCPFNGNTSQHLKATCPPTRQHITTPRKQHVHLHGNTSQHLVSNMSTYTATHHTTSKQHVHLHGTSKGTGCQQLSRLLLLVDDTRHVYI